VQQRHILMLERWRSAKLERADEDINLRQNLGIETASEALRAGPGLHAALEYGAIVDQKRDDERR
jgi:hypothetical protein